MGCVQTKVGFGKYYSIMIKLIMIAWSLIEHRVLVGSRLRLGLGSDIIMIKLIMMTRSRIERRVLVGSRLKLGLGII